MTSDGTVNAQIVDSVAVSATLLTGQSPSQAFGMLDTVMAETLGMAMHNAVMRQQAGSMVSSAAVTAACAKMLQAPYPLPTPPTPSPPPPPPPTIDKLDPPPPNPPPPASAVIAAAVAEGEAAIGTLKAEAQASSGDATAAQKGLAQIAKDATVTPSPPPPPPPPPAKDGGKSGGKN